MLWEKNCIPGLPCLSFATEAHQHNFRKLSVNTLVKLRVDKLNRQLTTHSVSKKINRFVPFWEIQLFNNCCVKKENTTRTLYIYNLKCTYYAKIHKCVNIMCKFPSISCCFSPLLNMRVTSRCPQRVMFRANHFTNSLIFYFI